MDEKLDHFFASADWVLEFQSAQVLHLEKQSLNHSILVLNSNPKVTKYKRRFFLNNQLLDNTTIINTIGQAWNQPQRSHFMIQVRDKIKETYIALLKLKGSLDHNSAHTINSVKIEIEQIQIQGSLRKWSKWSALKKQLDQAYNEEERF